MRRSGWVLTRRASLTGQKSHTSLDPVSVRQEARKFALEAIDVQKAEMKQLGVMADWDNPDGVYRTLGV